MQKRTYTLSELAHHLQAELKGDPNCVIKGIAPLHAAKNGQLSFLYDVKLKRYLTTTHASAVILSHKLANDTAMNCLLMKNPHLGYAKAAELFSNMPSIESGIHPTVVMGKNCQIATSATIAAHCVLGDNVTIGENTILHPGCTIGVNSRIGSNCIIWANVSVYYGVTIGNNVIIHSGAVIGADGFGMANENGHWHKIPQIGGVIIGNDVEIGANTTIDRGALEDTVIEEGVKLDNQIQIAHNVQIGAHTIIAACAAIAGSAKIGKHCMIGGAAAINGHLEIADGVMLTAAAMVPSSIAEAGVYSSGTGLQPIALWKKNIVRFQQLDEMARKLKKLEKMLNEFHGD